MTEHRPTEPLRSEHRDLLLSDDDPDSLVDRLAAWEPVHPSRWNPSEAQPA